MTNEQKICHSCELFKPLNDFYRMRKDSNEYRSRCKKCVEEQNKAWRIANPNKHREIYQRANHKINLAKRFGLTVEEFTVLWESHNGCCDICKQPETRKRRLSLDHNHETNELRGFVCSRCNLLLGNAKDDANLLEKAVTYLRNPPLRVPVSP